MTIPAQIANVTNPFSGVFGNGEMQIIPVSGTFNVPVGVSRVRVRLWGAGASGLNNGAGGGGFAMKVINLGAASSVAVTVGAPTAGAAGGTSSFGTFVSATGGSATTPFTGGTGVGGDVNYSGGNGATSAGAGGAANLFGNGGNGGSGNGFNGASGGGAGTGDLTYAGGNGIFSTGGGSIVTNGAPVAATSGMISPSIDLIGTGGGGSWRMPNGVNGGGGAASANVGSGGFPGGGTYTYTFLGARGLVIVEY